MNDRKTWLVVSGGSTDTEVPAGWPTGHGALPGIVQAAFFAACNNLPVKALLAPGVPTRREACEKLHAALAESQKREAALREQNERMRKVLDMIALETSIAVGRAIDANRDVVVLVEDSAQAAREKPVDDPDEWVLELASIDGWEPASRRGMHDRYRTNEEAWAAAKEAEQVLYALITSCIIPRPVTSASSRRPRASCPSTRTG